MGIFAGHHFMPLYRFFPSGIKSPVKIAQGRICILDYLWHQSIY